MKVYCTYCSRKKDEAPGLLPAIKRYMGGIIKDVHAKAIIENVELFILSGRFGFIHCEAKIPWYNQRLKDDQVPKLVEKLRWQLTNYEISELTYYTELPEDHLLLKPYNKAIEQACRENDIKFEKRFWTKEG